ncbi:MAG: hypothetical protein WCO00_04040 [Rhodospirillaceae bacterium]
MLLLLLLLLLTPGGAAPLRAEPLGGTIDQRSRQQVTALFTAGQTAMVKSDGAALLGQLSRASRTRLEAIRAAARLGPAAALAGFSPSEKLGVLALRKHFTPTQLRHLGTPDLVGHALGSHWLKPETLRGAELGPVALSGNRASAPVLIEGRPSLARAEFVREGGQWRIDLTRTTSSADTLLKVLIQLSGRGEEAYLGQLLAHLR